jgi:hypothetical protein
VPIHEEEDEQWIFWRQTLWSCKLLYLGLYYSLGWTKYKGGAPGLLIGQGATLHGAQFALIRMTRSATHELFTRCGHDGSTRKKRRHAHHSRPGLHRPHQMGVQHPCTRPDKVIALTTQRQRQNTFTLVPMATATHAHHLLDKLTTAGGNKLCTQPAPRLNSDAPQLATCTPSRLLPTSTWRRRFCSCPCSNEVGVHGLPFLQSLKFFTVSI